MYLYKEDLFAVHVRNALGQGADDEEEILPNVREHDLAIVRSDVKDFGPFQNEGHAGVVLLHDDTMPAYRVASALITMVDTYPGREAFAGREELDSWA